MSLKFFADHCVPDYFSNRLREAGFEVDKLREKTAIDSPDKVVIDKAQELKAILISLNGDFADIIKYPPEKYFGIISLQVRDHPELFIPILSRLLNYLKMNPNHEDYSGNLFIIEADRIRIRRKDWTQSY